MYLIELTSDAGATRCVGEVTVAPLAGVETHTDPAGPDPGLLGLAGAGSGNGATPVLGPFAMVTGTTAHDAWLEPGGGEEFGVLAPGDGGVELLPVTPDRPPQASTDMNDNTSTIRELNLEGIIY